MRVAGMISFVLVLVAAVFGIYSLGEAFAFSSSEIFHLLWPVAVGVTALAAFLLAVGRLSARALNRRHDDETSQNNKPR